jgi:hypothetical protein
MNLLTVATALQALLDGMGFKAVSWGWRERSSSTPGWPREPPSASVRSGVSSIRALLQSWVTVGVRSAWGWSGLFYLFVGLALVSRSAWCRGVG